MFEIEHLFITVQLLNQVQLFSTPWTAALQTELSFTVSWNLLRLMSTESLMPSNYLILCHSLLLLPSTLPGSGSFQMSQLFTSVGPSIRVPTSASVLPMNIQGWFPLGLTSLISLLSKGLSRVFTTTAWSINSLALSLLYDPTLTSIHDYWKKHNFDKMDLCRQCLSF